VGIDIGHRYRAAFKKHTNAWGSGLPIALGAGDQLEFNTESLKANVELVMNEGLYGSAFRRVGSPGNQKPGGDMDFDLYYRDGGGTVGGGHQILALGMGSDAVTALGGGAHRHDLTLLSNHTGLYGTLVFGSDELVVEHPFAKVSGLKLAWDQGSQRCKITPSFIGFEKNVNVGAADATFVVANAAAANGVKTIAAQPPTPSPLKITLTGVTELITVIVYTNIRGDQVTETHTRSTGGLTYTTLQYAKSAISITCSAIAGAGNFQVTTSNGVNNQTTLAAVTTDTFRDPILFSQGKFHFNDQAGADFVGTDEQFIDSMEMNVNLGMDQRVTSQFGYRIEQPSTGGSGRPSAGLTVKFSALTDRNRRHFWDMVGKAPLKGRAVFTGPQVASSGIAHSLTIYFNGIQYSGDDPNVGGPGVLPVSFTGEANNAIAAPTGFPGGVIQPVFMQLVNGLATAII